MCRVWKEFDIVSIVAVEFPNVELQAQACREWNYHIGKTYSVVFQNFS